MKIRIAAILFMVALVLQGTLLNLFSIFGGTANLLLCLVIMMTFLYENENAIYLGLFFGILSDIAYSDMVGIASLGFLLVGYLTVQVRQILNKENVFSVLILSISGTLIYNVFYWFVTNLFNNNIDFLIFAKLQPVYIIYNLIIMMMIYFSLINRVVKHRKDRYYK